MWYHYDCCEKTPFAKRYITLDDHLQVPLLKGGPLGLVGTPPLVFSAAKTAEKIQRTGGNAACDWKELLEEELGQPAIDFLTEKAEGAAGPVTSNISCPKCDTDLE